MRTDVEEGGIAADGSGGAGIALPGRGTRRSRRSDHAGPERPCQSRAEAGSSPGAGHCHGRDTSPPPSRFAWPALGVLRACQAAHDAVERVRKEAEKAEVLARSEAAEAEQLAREATQAVEPARTEWNEPATGSSTARCSPTTSRNTAS